MIADKHKLDAEPGTVDFREATDGDRSGGSRGLTGCAKEIRDEVETMPPLETSTDPYRNVPIPVYVWRKKGRDFFLAGFNKEAEVLTSGVIRKYLGVKARDYLRDDPESLANLNSCFEQRSVLRREGYYTTKTKGDRKYLVIQWVFAPPDSVIVHILDGTEQKRIEDESRMLARFPEDSPHPILRLSRDGVVQYANPSAASLLEHLGASIGETLPKGWSDIVARLGSGEDSIEVELRAGARTYLMTAHAVQNSHSIYLYGNDITDLKDAEERLRLSARVFESTIEGIMLTDPSGKIVTVNAAFTNITGFRPEEAIGQTPRLLKSDRYSDDFYRGIWESLERKGVWQGELWNRRKSGETYPQWTAISEIRDSDGQVKAYVSVFNDISELKRTQAQVEYQALHDPLTSLPNRALFSDRLDRALKSSSRGGDRFSLLYLDLDRFKNINDSLGHTIGDHLLRDVADRLRSRMRASDTVARLGGDEFVILLEAIKQPSDLAGAAGRVLGAFHEPFAIEGHEFFITASIGISVFPEDGESGEELVRNADLAMYHAKKVGGDRFQFFSMEMHAQVSHRVRLENHLRRALELEQLRVDYQPLVDASTGNVFGAEALLRWDHPDLGPVSPCDFISLAEETGLICPIGAWVLHHACRQARAWHEGGLKNVCASVNVSARQLSDNSFPDQVRRIIADNDICGECLTLEITENTLMAASHQAIQILRNLKEVGIRISIDDFGTGYSSLSYLKRFPIDTLKIDRSFVIDLPEDRESIAITRSIVALAKNLDLQVLAEGVETRAQLDFLAAAGCDRIQGYYFSRPVAAEEIKSSYPLD